MKFEEFEKRIREMGYGIAAMNHYIFGGKNYTYCVVLGKNDKAFQAEGESSEKVFEMIINKIMKHRESTKLN
ncbi:MAG: hypothetical protein V1818_00340 [Candidatus Aenigmatarchaeota archaeon]